MRLFGFLLQTLAVWVAMGVVGCVTTTLPPEAVVLERSELGRPQWVTNSLEVEPPSEKWFVYEKSDIIRLDLGIRQAQSSALSAHCQLIATRMRNEIESALKELARQSLQSNSGNKGGGSASGLTPEGLKAVESALQQLGQSQTCPELELKDVYWESLRKPSPDGPRTSYSVYVLLRLRQLPFDDVLAMTAESLKLSGLVDVQPLAEVLRGRMSNSSQRGTNE
jgi:hypothetical protein